MLPSTAEDLTKLDCAAFPLDLFGDIAADEIRDRASLFFGFLDELIETKGVDAAPWDHVFDPIDFDIVLYPWEKSTDPLIID